MRGSEARSPIAEREGIRKRRALLIVNEKSRQGIQGGDIVARVLEQGGIQLYRESCTSGAQLAEKIAQVATEIDLVVLGGGDGTLHAAAPALVVSRLPLGIVPLGTANDLARTLQIPTDPEAAAQVIVDGHLHAIDLGEVNGIPFFNVASIGLSVEVTRELTRDVKRRWGRLSYGIATLRALTRMRPFQARLHYDGEWHHVQTLQISVGNGLYYGGGIAVEENAKIDDACLNVYSLELDRLWKLALIYPAFRRGRHGLWKEVRAIRCTAVEVQTSRPRVVNADGELTSETPAFFRVLPRAVLVAVPMRSSAHARVGPRVGVNLAAH